MSEKSKSAPEECTRYTHEYGGENLYIVVGEEAGINLSMTNRDSFKTLAGLSLIETLINALLREGMSLEEIAGMCWESSYQTGDLPWIVQSGILWHIDRKAGKVDNE